MDFFKSMTEILGYLDKHNIEDLKLTSIQFTGLLRKKKILDKHTVALSQKQTEYYRNQIRHQEIFKGVIGLMNNYNPREVTMFIDSLVRNSYLSLKTVAMSKRKPYYTLQFEREKYKFLMQYLESCGSTKHTYVLPIPETDKDEIDWINLPNDTQEGNDFIFDHIPSKPLIPFAAPDAKTGQLQDENPKTYTFTIDGAEDSFLRYILDELKRRLEFVCKMFPTNQMFDLNWVVENMPTSSHEHWLGNGDRTTEVIYLEIKNFISIFQIRRKDAKWHSRSDEKNPMIQIPVNPVVPSWERSTTVDSPSDTSKQVSAPTVDQNWTIKAHVPTMNIEIELDLLEELHQLPAVTLPARNPTDTKPKEAMVLEPLNQRPGQSVGMKTTTNQNTNITTTTGAMTMPSQTQPQTNKQLERENPLNKHLSRDRQSHLLQSSVVSKQEGHANSGSFALRKPNEMVSPFGAITGDSALSKLVPGFEPMRSQDKLKQSKPGTFLNNGFDPKYDESNFKEKQNINVNIFNPSQTWVDIFNGETKKRNQTILNSNGHP